jgi:hypothetical protein
MRGIRPPLTAALQGSPSETPTPTLSSWAVPTARDDEIWEAMTREQQLAALQEHFALDDCTAPSSGTIAEIVARARAGRSGS